LRNTVWTRQENETPNASGKRERTPQAKQDDKGDGFLLHLGNAIHILTVKSLVHSALGNAEQALKLAESEGYIRVFVDEGAPMARLLRRMLTRSAAAEYVHRLLDALGESVEISPPISGKLIDPLSQRELEVLGLIAAGGTNQEIAHELVLTVYTVKRHISNIFGKLQVSNRAQAIARARESNLL
jgi:LuxR family maltose regulon positive regulatory protein